MVTYCYYAAIDLGDRTTIYVEQQTEYLVRTDPVDPGGTEVWSPYTYTALADQPTFGSVEAATAAAKPPGVQRGVAGPAAMVGGLRGTPRCGP